VSWTSGEHADGEDRPPADTDVLARLRLIYTPRGWGILHDGRGTWTAVNSPGPDIVKGHPAALRAAIDADRRNTNGASLRDGSRHG
jgi:hypothetical protein